MNTRTLIIILIILVLVAIGFAVFGSHTSVPAENNDDVGVVCTMEAKLCPDGSYVGRTGPHCEFAACPGATSTPSTTINATVR